MSQPKENKIFLKYTEGCCWRRILDLKQVEDFLRSNGYEIVQTADEADTILLETCAFVKRTEDISIREIDEINQMRGKKRFIVSGCLPGINKERMREHFQGDAINTCDMEKLNELFPDAGKKLRLMDDTSSLFLQKNLQSLKPTIKAMTRFFISSLLYGPKCWRMVAVNVSMINRSGFGFFRKGIRYLRIAWGCPEPHCSFCVEWMAVGSKTVSKPVDEICAEIERDISQGYKKFALVADNPGTWGIDHGKKFTDLLGTILSRYPDITIVNIDGLHPFWMWKNRNEFAKLLKTGRIKSIMSPLQSGSNRILGLMKRGYTKEQYAELMSMCRDAYPDMVLITQIIVGFPSETDAEFMESVDLVVKLGFNNVTMFPFYTNPHTPAAQMDGVIDNETKFRRIAAGNRMLKKNGIFSLNFGIEIDPQHQKVKAIYENR